MNLMKINYAFVRNYNVILKELYPFLQKNLKIYEGRNETRDFPGDTSCHEGFTLFSGEGLSTRIPRQST